MTMLIKRHTVPVIEVPEKFFTIFEKTYTIKPVLFQEFVLAAHRNVGPLFELGMTLVYSELHAF